jgi:hypothetical protein
MQIIVRNRKTEGQRRNQEAAAAARKSYHDREIRDGSRFQSKAGSKAEIKKALDATD